MLIENTKCELTVSLCSRSPTREFTAMRTDRNILLEEDALPELWHNLSTPAGSIKTLYPS